VSHNDIIIIQRISHKNRIPWAFIFMINSCNFEMTKTLRFQKNRNTIYNSNSYQDASDPVWPLSVTHGILTESTTHL